MTELLSVGPETEADDEQVIARGYKAWLPMLILIAFMLGVAWFSDVKWVLTAGFAVVIALAHQTDGRLHDLCVRVRRTNLLLREIRGARAQERLAR
jgi:hypothetical protein